MRDPTALEALLNCIGGSPLEEDPRLRRTALAALRRLHRRAPALAIREAVALAAIDCDLNAAARYRAALGRIPGGLLQRAVSDAWFVRRENVFRGLSLLYPSDVVDGCYRALVSNTARRQDAARDLIDEGLPSSVAARLEPVLRLPSTESQVAANTDLLASLTNDPDPWIRRCANSDGRTDCSGSDRMDEIDKVFLLQRVDVFREVTSDQLALLAGIAEQVEADTGAVLLRPEEVPDAVYVLVRGEVRLQFPRDEATITKAGEGFGALSVIGQRPALLTATVTQPSTLLRLSHSDLADLLVDSPELGLALLRGMAHRVEGLLARVEG